MYIFLNHQKNIHLTTNFDTFFDKYRRRNHFWSIFNAYVFDIYKMFWTFRLFHKSQICTSKKSLSEDHDPKHHDKGNELW